MSSFVRTATVKGHSHMNVQRNLSSSLSWIYCCLSSLQENIIFCVSLIYNQHLPVVIHTQPSVTAGGLSPPNKGMGLPETQL